MEISLLLNFFSSLPADWIIVGSFGVLALVDALRVGSARISTLAVAALITLVVHQTFAPAVFLGALSATLSTPVLQAALFGVLYVIVFIFIRRVYIDYGELQGQPLQAIVAAVAVTALMLVVWVQVPALQAVWHFGGQVAAVFGDSFRFWWIFASLGALAFAKA
jgi:hypothetical protein